jgi:2-polyprenyl-3-methyl-5-hydroxy-6-metoxy-1,4-benzoquinol methylase
MTRDADLASRELDRYAQAYDQHAFEAVQAAMRKRMLLEILDQRRPAQVLEVGCGRDTLANHWREARRFTIVEPAAAFAAGAREDTAGRQDVEVIEATLEQAAAELTGGYDLVLVSSLLHEVADADALMAAVFAVCGPDTLVHVNVPNARSFHRLLALEMGLIPSPGELSAAQIALQQQRTFTAETLESLTTAHGFSVVERGAYFVKPFTHGQMQDLQENGFLSPAMLEGLWGMAKHIPDLGSEIFVNLRPAI